ADGFGSVRALLTARERWAKRAAHARRGRLRQGAREMGLGREGRWSLLHAPAPIDASAGADGAAVEELAEAVAEQLLARYAVAFRDLAIRETGAVPWREVLWALRRMAARGTARGGPVLTGFVRRHA